MKVADMLGEPHWDSAKGRNAASYARSIVKAINTFNDDALRELYFEIREDDEFCAAVICSLPTPCRQYLGQFEAAYHASKR